MNQLGIASRQLVVSAFRSVTLPAILLYATLFVSEDAHGQGVATGSQPLTLGQEYSTSGHPKAKGLVVSLKFPAGWQAAEGERPNIVQKFSEQRPDGLSRMAILGVRNLPEDLIGIDENELYAELSSIKDLAKELGEMFPPNARIMSARVTKYDGAPGLLCTYEMQAERAGFRLESHTVAHMVFHKGRLLVFECSAGGLADSPGAVSLFQESLPLFIMMGNSIVLQDKWTSGHVSVVRTGESGSGASSGGGWILGLILSVALTWGIGLTPPLLIRFAVLRRPLAKAWAWGVAVCFCLFNLVLFVVMGSQNKTHGALILIALASYGILRAGGKRLHPQTPSSPDQPTA